MVYDVTTEPVTPVRTATATFPIDVALELLPFPAARMVV